MTSPKQKQDLLVFARKLAVEAGNITLRYFGESIEVESKADSTPVTIADRETEEFIRKEISNAFPDHAIVGEEFSDKHTDSEFTWVVDPIDGTASFIRNIPLYSVLIAVLYNSNPILGVIYIPPTNDIVYAAEGLGCYFNGRRASVSETKQLRDSWVQVTDFAELNRRRPLLARHLLENAFSCRAWGDAYGYLLVATGKVDVMIDPIMQPWDIAPLKPIITEAGGVFTDLDGNADGMGTSAIACNRGLHEEILNPSLNQ